MASGTRMSALVTTAYLCTRCTTWFGRLALVGPAKSCAAIHRAGECCHVGELPIQPPVYRPNEPAVIEPRDDIIVTPALSPDEAK